MSTNGYVAIKENGMYRFIFNQYDSGIERLGITLFKHYNNTEKARALIDMGNTTTIGYKLENDVETEEEFRKIPVNERGTVTKFRDLNRWRDCNLSWDECKPGETDEIANILDTEYNAPDEYAYIFDTETEKWFIGLPRDKWKLRELEAVLHSKDLLRQLFSDMYREECLPEFYETCMSA